MLEKYKQNETPNSASPVEKEENLPRVFDYTNYRHYLKDFYETKKRQNHRFSYRVFARLAGFTSPSYLKLVIDGKRNMSHSTIFKVVKALKLNREATLFFEALVHFNQCSNYEEKTHYYKKITLSKSYKEVKSLQHKYYSYLSKWFYPVIREITFFKNFIEDPEWIAKQIGSEVSPKDVKEALTMLLELGLLTRDKNGKLKAEDKNLSTDPEVFDLSVMNYQKEMIGKSIEALEKTEGHNRDFSSLTIALNKNTFEKAKKEIQDFRRRLNVLLSEAEDTNAVYQLNMELFNLTQIPWENNEETKK